MRRAGDRHIKRALRSYKIRNLCVRASIAGRRSRIERVPERVVDGNRVGIRCYSQMMAVSASPFTEFTWLAGNILPSLYSMVPPASARPFRAVPFIVFCHASSDAFFTAGFWDNG